MSSPDFVLTLVSDQKDQLMLHGDAKGLSMLITALERLKKKAEDGQCEHDHFFSESWSSPESCQLSERKGCEKEGEVIRHLKLYGWNAEWAKRHGFIE